MKTRLMLILFVSFSLAAFSQSTLPSELKGNWLNANDSIEWIASFQPGFAVFENQFWDYKSIQLKEGKYLLQLSNATQNKTVSATIKDKSTLLLSFDSKEDVRCTKRKAVKPDFNHYDTLGFAEPLLMDDTVTIKGFIEDYDPEIYQTFGAEYYYSVLTLLTENYKTEFDIHSDGRFELKFRCFNPQFIVFVLEGSTMTRAFVYPGETLMIGFNNSLGEVTRNSEKWKEISDWEINHYMGRSGLVSEELLWLTTFYENKLIPPIDKATNMELMPQMEYMKWRKEVYAKEIKSIDSLMTVMRCSKKAVQYMQKSLETDLVTDLYHYPVQMGDISQLDPQFIDGIPTLAANSELYLLCESYRSYINYLSFFHNHQFYGGLVPDTFKPYLLYILNFTTDEDEKHQINDLIEKINEFQDITGSERSTITESGQYDSINNQRAREIDKAYFKLIKKNLNSIPDSIRTHVRIMELNYAMQKYNRGLTAQMYAMHWMLLIGKNSPLNPEIIAWAKQNITYPVLINYLLEDHKKKEEAATKFTTYAENTIFLEHINSENSSDIFFQEILDQFKGKVVYIDFWADWCSPCRAGFKPAARLKKELSGRDVVFLYFGISCTNQNWKNVIMSEQLSGYHYWLDKEQGQMMKQKFGFSGIPHYLLVDKTGHVCEGEAPPPAGLVEVLEKIEELLKM